MYRYLRGKPPFDLGWVWGAGKRGGGVKLKAPLKIKKAIQEDSMKHLFISQPMRDHTDEEIISARERAKEDAREQLNDDVVVVSSYFPKALINGNTPLYLLGKSMVLMSTADVAYFVKGWEQYRGCRIEHECAKEYGVKIIYEE